MSRSTLIGVGVKFQRVARITGYLVGTIDRWNDAKRDELRSRVKHNTEHQLTPCKLREALAA